MTVSAHGHVLTGVNILVYLTIQGQYCFVTYLRQGKETASVATVVDGH